MNLTKEQLQAAEQGEAVTLEADGKRFVLLTEAVYVRIRKLIEYTDSPLTPEEQQAALQEAGRLAGWDDPELDTYNELDPRRS